MLCVTIGRTRHTAMIAEYEHLGQRGADLTEMRLDFIGRSVDLRRLLAKRHTPVLITCRRREDGGRWDRDEGERLMILRSAIATGVDFVDLEEDIAAQIPRYGSTKRIVSLHNFEITPPDLPEIHARLARLDADVVKIATLANSFEDCIRMMELVRSAQIPTVGICMGEIGMVTRILALHLGAPLTYCAMSSERKLAPGQISYEHMKDLYRVKQINGQTRLFGVVADPVAHSLSPLIHNTAFAHHGLNACYLPFRVPADDLPLFFDWCRQSGVAGLSVTIPHKEAMLKLVDEAESAAVDIGALNTVVFRGGASAGYNTDYRAAMDCLQAALKTQKTVRKSDDRDDDLLRGRSVLLLGAGGVARAIGYGVRQRGGKVIVASRTVARAEELAHELGGEFVPWSERHSVAPGILVNCSPIGMHPDIDSSPFQIGKGFSADTIVFDTVYNPENTVLIKDAKREGCFFINGLDMFVRQAAYQYKLFTGQEAPSSLLRDTVKRATSPVNF
ncbi:MAG: shikimate dehydrogenase [Pirellulaceae bacterium]|nr:shikimate dehydrogenase [Pirellulaceae bacterium]